MAERYLTKSRFKLAVECPTKLYYTRKSEYENKKADDEFMQSLAEGGYQVGELAKCYYPGGHDITEAHYKIPLKRTSELLRKEEVIIFEAAIRYQHLFIRVDILEKKGNTIRLIEVKAKSTDGSNFTHFLNKSGGITKEWKPYLYDVAFQHHVVKSAFPDKEITCYLMLADKTATASVDGLNQRFPIHKIRDGKIAIEKNSDLSNADLGTPLLKEINVDTIIEQIESEGIDGSSFKELVHAYASAYESDTKIKTPLGIQCGSCEFKTFSNTKKSGFHECWKDQTRLTDSDLSKPMVFDLWNFRGVEKLLNEGTYLLKDVEKSAFGEIKPGPFGALSTKERQWLQVEKEKENDRTTYLDTSLFFIKKQEFSYPLHFIDFETSMVAIPFNKGRKPYEQIAFQYSHHIMEEDGSVRHADQYIHTKQGEFPNFIFIRSLKDSLEKDQGTIFRYAAHENTVLNQIRDQLNLASEIDVPDKKELIAFIEAVTERKSDNYEGERSMVDMLEMVKQFHYDPLTQGSNSIKAVLPAVLERSKELQEKYSKPIYGADEEIPSLNFEQPIAWIQYDEVGDIINPYSILPPISQGLNSLLDSNLYSSDYITGGGAAMTAYARMQFSEMSEEERQALADALLRYCELDTFAMVLIFQYWEIELERKATTK